MQVKPDQEFEQTKEKIRERITELADEADKRKHEMMKLNEEANDEQVDEEDEDEGLSESKSSTSAESTTAESEPEVITSKWTKRLWSPNAHQLSTDAIIATSTQPKRASQLPPLTDIRPKPQLTSIKSIDFDIPELEKSPSTQSSDTPRNSPSPPVASKTPTKDVDELSEIESIAGIDQLLDSGRSDSISF